MYVHIYFNKKQVVQNIQKEKFDYFLHCLQEWQWKLNILASIYNSSEKIFKDRIR